MIAMLFTRRRYNPVSWLIRWALPLSRFKWSQSSHVMVIDGDHVVEASMLHGVRRVPFDEAMRSQTVVKWVVFTVPDTEAGMGWIRSQVGKPYDFKGAFGLSLTPTRDWQEDDCWFCYELAAATLHAAGREVFARTGHISEAALLAIKP